MRHMTFEKYIGGTFIAIGLILALGQTSHAKSTPATGQSTSQVEKTEQHLSDLKPTRPAQSRSGSLMFKTDTPGRYLAAPMVRTDVQINIAGPVIRTRLSQVFENTTDEWVEGVYVFPLPENAAVDHMRMVVGGRLIEGKIKEKQQARRIYQKARAQGKKASLLEQERPNIFTASVANIGPHEKIAIQIDYQDKVKIKQGLFSLRFPMSVAPRYSPPPQALQIADRYGHTRPAILDPVLDRDRISPPVQNPAEEPIKYTRLPVSLDITLQAGFDLQDISSPYHDIRVETTDTQSRHITLKDGPVPANRDFKLEWKPRPSSEPYKAVFRQDFGDETYLLSMLTPPASTAHSERIARESIFVIDTSGSMGGTSIGQARKALTLALQHLQPEDTFNIIRFSDTHSALFLKPRPASEANIAKARRFITHLQARGGTEMYPALKDALSQVSAREGRLAQIMFITDGAIGNERQLFGLLKDELGRARLFPVGIGSAPNSYFMSRAAKFGRGTYVQIGDIQEVASRMSRLFTAIDAPVLINLKTSLAGESYPARLPDLYVGEPIVSVTRLPKTAVPKQIHFTGQRAAQPWSAVLRLEEIPMAKGLDVLWARDKIAALEESRFSRATAADIDAQILKTALKHHLVSRLTSLVAVDIEPSRPLEARLDRRKVPTMLPEGWDFAKLAYTPDRHAENRASVPAPIQTAARPLTLPATASPHVWLLLQGALLFLLGLAGLHLGQGGRSKVVR